LLCEHPVDMKTTMVVVVVVAVVIDAVPENTWRRK